MVCRLCALVQQLSPALRLGICHPDADKKRRDKAFVLQKKRNDPGSKRAQSTPLEHRKDKGLCFANSQDDVPSIEESGLTNRSQK